MNTAELLADLANLVEQIATDHHERANRLEAYRVVLMEENASWQHALGQLQAALDAMHAVVDRVHRSRLDRIDLEIEQASGAESEAEEKRERVVHLSHSRNAGDGRGQS
jgi:hypothetical protein